MVIPMAKPPIGREIGEKLRRVAVARGMTQGQVAANAHVSQPTISSLFGGGTVDPPIGTVTKVCQVLGISIDELVGFKPLQIPEPAEPADGRLESLEGRFDQLAAQVEKLSSSLLQYVNEAHGNPAQPRRGHRKAS